jgi:hypothetical protein
MADRSAAHLFCAADHQLRSACSCPKQLRDRPIKPNITYSSGEGMVLGNFLNSRLDLSLPSDYVTRLARAIHHPGFGPQ